MLADFEVGILDVGQAVIHDTLSLGVLVELPNAAEHATVVAAILARATELDIQVRFTPVSAQSYQNWVAGQGRARYIITLLARKITAHHLMRVTGVVSRNGLNIDAISRLSGRIPLGEAPSLSKACVEFSVRGQLDDIVQFRETCWSWPAK